MGRWLFPACLLFSCLMTTGCYLGSARNFSPTEIQEESGWIFVPDVPLVRQSGESDCGAAALAMAMAYWGSPIALEEIGAAYPRDPGHGFKAGELRDFARARGLAAFLMNGRMIDIQLELQKRRPVIVGLLKRHPRRFLSHYEVVVGIHPKEQRIATLDPARGWRQNTWNGFLAEWRPAGQVTLVMFKADEARLGATSQDRGLLSHEPVLEPTAGQF